MSGDVRLLCVCQSVQSIFSLLSLQGKVQFRDVSYSENMLSLVADIPLKPQV